MLAFFFVLGITVTIPSAVIVKLGHSALRGRRALPLLGRWARRVVDDPFAATTPLGSPAMVDHGNGCGSGSSFNPMCSPSRAIRSIARTPTLPVFAWICTLAASTRSSPATRVW